MTITFQPPYTPGDQLDHVLVHHGHAVIDSAALQHTSGCSVADLVALHQAWGRLPPDPHLRDGGHYRLRRHSCFLAEDGVLQQVPHRPHWQPVEYNALHGGMLRHFEPVEPDTVAQHAWGALLRFAAARATALRGPHRWYIEAHPFRIDASEGIGRPTPEGAHRDGVDLVMVMLMGRLNVKGGETRVFDATGPAGLRFTLNEPFSALLLDDARVIHETTPIQPLTPGAPAWRDTLVLTCRAHGFQGPA